MSREVSHRIKLINAYLEFISTRMGTYFGMRENGRYGHFKFSRCGNGYYHLRNPITGGSWGLSNNKINFLDESYNLSVPVLEAMLRYIKTGEMINPELFDDDLGSPRDVKDVVRGGVKAKIVYEMIGIPPVVQQFVNETGLKCVDNPDGTWDIFTENGKSLFTIDPERDKMRLSLSPYIKGWYGVT